MQTRLLIMRTARRYARIVDNRKQGSSLLRTIVFAGGPRRLLRVYLLHHPGSNMIPTKVYRCSHSTRGISLSSISCILGYKYFVPADFRLSIMCFTTLAPDAIMRKERHPRLNACVSPQTSFVLPKIWLSVTCGQIAAYIAIICPLGPTWHLRGEERMQSSEIVFSLSTGRGNHAPKCSVLWLVFIIAPCQREKEGHDGSI